MDHSNLTIVAVYGHTDGSSAVPSILKALQELPGSKAKLISIAKPEDLPDSIEHHGIFNLDYFQYSWFMIYALHNFINTSHALIVQDDGWVINGKNFNPNWYKYDYIGAPTHCALTADKYYYNWTWQQVDEPMHIIQNGGLCMRSKRFLQAPGKYGIIHKSHNVIPFCNEDVQLTGFMRNELEQVGMLYAPPQEAKYFSVEYMGPTFHDDFEFDKLFGCHGPTRKLAAEELIRVNVTKNKPENMHRELEFLNFLMHKGFSVEYFTDETAIEGRTQEADAPVL